MAQLDRLRTIKKCMYYYIFTFKLANKFLLHCLITVLQTNILSARNL